jgi:hypothetical protein
MEDGSHNLSEKIVILADYFLIKTIDNKLIPSYLNMFKINKNITENELIKYCNINERILLELNNEIKNILCKI